MSHRLGLRLLSTVTRATTAALINTSGIEASADDGVLDTDVLHAATAEHDHRVLLEVVAFSWDVGGNFHAVSKTHAGDLTNSGVRLARGLGSYLDAHATLERGWIKGRAVLEVVEPTAEREDF